MPLAPRTSTYNDSLFLHRDDPSVSRLTPAPGDPHGSNFAARIASPPKLQVTEAERDSVPSFWDLGIGIRQGPEKSPKPGVGEMEGKGSPGVGEQALRPRCFSSTTIRRVWADGRVRGFGETKTVAFTT